MLDILGMVVGVRMIAAKTRYYHIYDQEEDKREVYTTSLIFATGMSALAVLSLWHWAPAIAGLTLGSRIYARQYHLIFICFAIQNVYLFGENDLIIRKKSILFSSMSIGLMILSLSLNILFLSVFHLGAWAILWSIFITKLANLYVLPLTLRGCPMRFSWKKLKEMVTYGFPLVPASLAMFALHYGDRFFLQRFCSLSEVGVYSLGYKFGMMLSVLITAPFSRAWGTQSFEIAKQPDSSAVYARVFTYFSCLLMAIGLGISIFIKDVIGLMAPPTYARAAIIVPWVVLAYVFSGLAGFVGLGIMLSFRTKYVALIQVPIAGLNMLLNYYLIGSYGIFGAALSTLITFGLMFFTTFYISQRLYPIEYEYRRLSILALMAFALFAVSKLASGFSLLPILFHCAVFLAFPAGLVAFKFFTESELLVARKNISRFAPWLIRPVA
jgi:O-antigen/teichoic acid export membrane protein